MNYEQLTKELTELYSSIKNDKIDLAKAHELNNTAANITSVVRLSLLQAKLKGAGPDLVFFSKQRKSATKKGAPRG